MKKPITVFLLLAVFSGLAMTGCEQHTSPADITPQVAQANAEEAPDEAPTLAYGEAPKDEDLKEQNAWLWYAERLESGDASDPSGQYLSKNTNLSDVDADTSATKGPDRPERPKFDVTNGGDDHGFTEYTEKYPVGSPEVKACEDCLIAPNSDGTTCARCSATTFVSSLGQGGSGNVKDVKLVYGNGTVSDNRVRNAGYIRLNSDLNRGAGGAYQYLAFTRNPRQVLNGEEYQRNKIYTDPNMGLTSFAFRKVNHWYNTIPAPMTGFYDLWVPNQYSWAYWYAPADLNDGAGGKYIYCTQTRTPGSRWFNIPFNPINEIGVLSGCNSNIQPPAGWYKFPQDLNEGAGGDYIYLCVKY